MLKKLLTLSLVAVMLSVTAFAATDIADLSTVYAADTAPVFAYAGGDVDYVTETAKVAESYLAQAKHEDVADLTAWDGNPAEAIVGGKGTAEEPYLISDGAELAYFANAVNGKLTDSEGNVIDANTALCAKLDRDINLGTKNNWSSYSMVSYAGTFDGQGHNIYGFYLEAHGASSKRGMFNSVTGSGCVKNLNLIDVDVTVGSETSNGNTHSAVVCSSLSGTEANYSAGTQPTLNNIYVSGNAKISQKDIGTANPKNRLNSFGTVVGYVKYGDVFNCFSAVDVDFKNHTPANYSTYDKAKTVSSNIGIAGVVGCIGHDKNFTSIQNCGNSGDIYAPEHYRVAGVVGVLSGNSGSSKIRFNNLYNSGNITGKSIVAGVVAWTCLSNIGSVKNEYTGESDRYWSWFNNFNWSNTGNIVATTTENSFVAGVTNLNQVNTTDGRYPNHFYSTGDVKVVTTDAETGEPVESFGDKCALVMTVEGIAAANISGKKCLYRNDLGTAKITVTNPGALADDTSDDTTEEQTVNKWPVYNVSGVATTETNSKYQQTGTAKALAEIKALTADEIATACGSGFVPAFDGGLPILATQKNMLVLDEETYEIAKYTNASSEAVDKTLAIKATEAGYVALNVTAFVEGTSATLEVYTADGTTKIDEKAVSATGIVLLPTGEATEVLVKAAEGSRVLVKQAALPALDGVEATAIKATMDCDVDSATVILALFNGDTLQKVEYLANVASVDGKVTGVIDLTGENVTDCTLRAFLWANGTLAPINAEVAELR